MWGVGGTPYTLPTASSSVLGGIKVGTTLSINSGVLDYTNPNPTPYTLPIASASVLGGIKVGSRLSIDGSGVLSADVQAGGDMLLGTAQTVTAAKTFNTGTLISSDITGGTAVGSNIIYKSTTGIGTVAGIAHQWTGGTNGATVIATMLNNGNVGIGTTNPNELLDVNGNGYFRGADTKIYGNNKSSYINMYNSSTGGIDIYNLNGTAVSNLSGGLNITGALTVGSLSLTNLSLTNLTATGGITMNANDEKINGKNGNYINMYNSSTGGIDIYNLNGTASTKIFGGLNITGGLSVGGTLALTSLNMGSSGVISAGGGYGDGATLSIYDGATGNFNFTTGKNLSTTSFNWFTQATTQRMTLSSSGNLGIGVTSPTAYLNIKAGTATAGTAPLKFTSGPLNTTAEAGAVEFLTDAYYGTITTGAARKTFAFLESPVFTTPNIGSATGSISGNAGTATNLSGGLGGQIPYQSAVNTTAFLANGTAGQVLQSNGTTLAPSWVAAGTGTVTAVSVATANGVSGSSSGGATPALTIALGEITPTSVKIGTLGYTPANGLITVQGSVASYIQEILQNSNRGTTGSADYIVNNFLSTDSTYYGDFGMNSDGFTGSGAFSQPNNVYLTATTADLAIGTTTANAIHFVVNGGATDAMTISSTGVVTTTTQSANDNSTKVATTAYVDSKASPAVTDVQTFGTSSTSGAFTWTKPTNAKSVLVQMWAAGASGGANTNYKGAGGGGAYISHTFVASQLAGTVSITTGAGGGAISQATGTAGIAGGNTSFGSWMTVYGGAQGNGASNLGGGGGGILSAGVAGGAGGDPLGGATGATSTFGGGGGGNSGNGGNSIYGGGGGAGTTGIGGNSVYGGAGGGAGGGGGAGNAGGTSSFGGAGGAGAGNSQNGGAGSFPGGGGGANNGSNGSSGAGANGQVIVTTYF